MNNTISRWEPFRGLNTLQDQVNRLFEDRFASNRSSQADLAKVHEESYLRVERAYGTFTRSFSLPNTVSTEGIRAEYQNGVLSVHMPKREESKPKQVKISIAGNGKK